MATYQRSPKTETAGPPGERVQPFAIPAHPWVCVIKVCSNGGATYIIREIIAKDNLNIENLMQTFENLLLQNY